MAKLLQRDPTTGATVPLPSGGPAGKGFYMAPEVVATPRTPPGKPYPRPEAIDLWGLGLIIYIMLSGKHPFEGRMDVYGDTVSQA